MIAALVILVIVLGAIAAFVRIERIPTDDGGLDIVVEIRVPWNTRTRVLGDIEIPIPGTLRDLTPREVRDAAAEGPDAVRELCEPFDAAALDEQIDRMTKKNAKRAAKTLRAEKDRRRS